MKLRLLKQSVVGIGPRTTLCSVWSPWLDSQILLLSLWKQWGLGSKKLLLTTVLNGVCLVAQSYPTLYDPTDCSLSSFSVHGILQARSPEWVAISYSRGSSQPRDRTHVSCVSCFDRQIIYHWAKWEAHLLNNKEMWSVINRMMPRFDDRFENSWKYYYNNLWALPTCNTI